MTPDTSPTIPATTETSASTSSKESDPRVERTVEAAEHIVGAAVDVGRAWAAYGLRIGKLALETQAHTMGKLAGALGELHRVLDENREDEAARGAPASDAPASDAPTSGAPSAPSPSTH
jgi:hypothetical protein